MITPTNSTERWWETLNANRRRSILHEICPQAKIPQVEWAKLTLSTKQLIDEFRRRALSHP